MRFIPIRIKFFICAGNNVHIRDIYKLIGCFHLVVSNGRLCRIGGPSLRESRLTPSGPQEGIRYSRRQLLALLAFVVIAAGIAIYGSRLSAAPPVAYRLATVESGSIVNAVTTSGTVKPLAAILVGSEASGQITELRADFNSVVKKGDIVARLNDDAVLARLDQALVDVELASSAVEVQRSQLERVRIEAEGAGASIAVAKAEIDRAAAALRDAEREFERKRELFERGSGASVDRDRSEIAFQGASAQLAAAKGRHLVAISAEAGSRAAVRISTMQLANAEALVKLKEANVRQVRVDVDHTVIRAPIDGVIVERRVEMGQTVASSLQAPTLFTIAPDLRAMEVHANVDEADIGRVAAGQDVSFTVDSYPNRFFKGQVVAIRKMPQTSQNVVAYTVVISAENDDLALLPGMTANARITVRKSGATSLRVPNTALRYRPVSNAAPTARATNDQPATAARAEVWVVGAAGPEARRMTVGMTDGRMTEIVAGNLREGDRVIIGEDAAFADRAGGAKS
jgi:HlyD family secretion protein